VIIFFVIHEMTKGMNSFWYPYFQITEKTDMPQGWKEHEIDELQDQISKAEILDEPETMLEEFLILRDLAAMYPKSCNAEKWTYELFSQAHTLVITRCFGV
jgi:hypothetical protein